MITERAVPQLSGVWSPASTSSPPTNNASTGGRRWSIRRLAVTLLPLAVIATAGAPATRVVGQFFETSPPVVAGIDIHPIFIDDTPVPLTVTVAWEKVSFVATRDQVRSDVTLWRRMHFSDWDLVPEGLREQGLDAMLGRYERLLANPSEWDRMTADDWDPVPQPIRALAYRHMTEYWSGFYRVAAEHGVPPRLMANTLAAIVMSESWFEHRAVTVNRWGNEDRGLAQASDFARRRMNELYESGRVDADLSDDDYFNPWKGTQFVAIWMKLMLEEMRGDLEAAIRAYHRGGGAAFDSAGDQYLEAVIRRRQQFMRNEGNVPAWNYLSSRDGMLIGELWPWMNSPAPTSLDSVPNTQS